VPDRFTTADAFGWTLLLFVMLAFALALAPGGGRDLVTSASIEVIVVLGACALFAARRPGQGWSELFAMRGSSVASLLAALLLGVALCPPAERVAFSIYSVFPLPKELLEMQQAMMRVRSPLHGALLFLLAAGAGPFVEELFFRGALFTAQRRHATTVVTVGTTALLFTLFHPEPRTWAPILPLSVILGVVRARTGSMFPALLAHAGFNATTLAMSQVLPSETGPSLALVLGGLSAAVVLSGALWQLGKGDAARHARELDGGLPS
jgi:membrane protease YdiL (CAAX protease family)